MDAATLSRLEEFEKSGKFYDALQYCRTRLTRSFRRPNANEAALPLVKHALNFFLREKQHKCAIDIVTLYVECLEKNATALDEGSYEVIADIVAKLANLEDIETVAENLKEEQALFVARNKIVDIAIQWTKRVIVGRDDIFQREHGVYRLHTYFAKAYLAVGHCDLAQRHFLLSDDSDALAKMLHELAEEDKDKPMPQERIVETVLQLLVLDRYPFAIAVFKAYVAPLEFEFDVPVYNFLHILFDTIELEDRDRYVALKKTYAEELSKSTRTATVYFQRLGYLFFKEMLPPTESLGSLGLGNVIRRFFDDYESRSAVKRMGFTGASHISKRTPVPPKPKLFREYMEMGIGVGMKELSKVRKELCDANEEELD